MFVWNGNAEFASASQNLVATASKCDARAAQDVTLDQQWATPVSSVRQKVRDNEQIRFGFKNTIPRSTGDIGYIAGSKVNEESWHNILMFPSSNQYSPGS